MTTRRWAYTAVAGWAVALAVLVMVSALSMESSAATLVGLLVVVLIFVAAVVAAAGVWALVGGE